MAFFILSGDPDGANENLSIYVSLSVALSFSLFLSLGHSRVKLTTMSDEARLSISFWSKTQVNFH